MRKLPLYLLTLLLGASGVAHAGSVTGVSKASKSQSPRVASTKQDVRYQPDQTVAQSTFNRLIVKFRTGTQQQRNRALAPSSLQTAATRAGLKGVNGAGAQARPLDFKHVRRLAGGADVLVIRRSLDAAEMAVLLGQLRSDPSVEYAQPDYMRYASDATPNDPRFADLQWDFIHPTAGVNALGAWGTNTGEGAIVAVLDTGYVEHRDLNANIVPGYDFVSWYGQVIDGVTYPDIAGDGDGRDADARDPGDWLDGTENFCGSQTSPSSWHGSHVAGTIAAVANNAIGIAGLAHGAKVQPIRVLGHCGGLTSDIADGIVWASGGQVDGVPMNPNPAEVLNLSLGGFGTCAEDPVTQEAINGALSRGVTVVVAAGNNNRNAAQFTPASCTGVVTVGATGVDGGKAYYSNYGSVVTLSAPGGNAMFGDEGDTAWIWSPVNASQTSPQPSPQGDVLGGKIGTSMAAPHVAAVAAMMQSASVGGGHGALEPALLRAALRASIKPFMRPPASSASMGTGILDAEAAVRAAAAGITEASVAVPLVNKVALNGQAVAVGESLLYRIIVPAGTRSLSLRTYGGVGDVSLMVGRGTVPTSTQNVGHSARPGNTEALVLTNPVAGTYYLRMHGVAAAQEVSIMVTY